MLKLWSQSPVAGSFHASQTPEGERFTGAQGEGVGLLGLLIQSFPFVKTIGGNEAAPTMKRNPP